MGGKKEVNEKVVKMYNNAEYSYHGLCGNPLENIRNRIAAQESKKTTLVIDLNRTERDIESVSVEIEKELSSAVELDHERDNATINLNANKKKNAQLRAVLEGIQHDWHETLTSKQSIEIKIRQLQSQKESDTHKDKEYVGRLGEVYTEMAKKYVTIIANQQQYIELLK